MNYIVYTDKKPEKKVNYYNYKSHPYFKSFYNENFYIMIFLLIPTIFMFIS